jgi:hypothetical protein
MTGVDDPDSDTEVPICVRPEVVALACSRVRSMGEEVPHSTDSSERLSDNPDLPSSFGYRLFGARFERREKVCEKYTITTPHIIWLDPIRTFLQSNRLQTTQLLRVTPRVFNAFTS